MYYKIILDLIHKDSFNMDKKEVLIDILTQLEPIWNLAKWLKILVENWNLWDSMLDILIQAIQWAVHTVKSEKDKEKIQKWLGIMQKIKEIELNNSEQDEKDLKELDKMLENF